MEPLREAVVTTRCRIAFEPTVMVGMCSCVQSPARKDNAMIRRSLLLFVVLGSTAFAQADEETDASPVEYKDVTVLSFTDVEIEATLVAPQLRMLTEVRRGQFAPMIKLRTDFTPEMQQSTQDIQ